MLNPCPKLPLPEKLLSMMKRLSIPFRYGSYYISQMHDMAERNPDQYNLLVNNGLSVQAQDQYPLGTAADQRGEQTINRDAKTAGTELI